MLSGSRETQLLHWAQNLLIHEQGLTKAIPVWGRENKLNKKKQGKGKTEV